MRDRKKRNIMIASLCCLLVFMGIGYALLSQTLSINGTAMLTGKWNIYIDSITLSSKSQTANSVSSTVNQDKTGASFAVELLKPGDYVEYDVVIKNEGTINAVLRELIPNIETNNMDILLTHSIIQGQILKAKSETKFTLKVRFDERATEIANGGETTFDIQMVYEQYDGDTSSIVDGVVPVTANDCFTISDTGVITDYDYSCGTYVTIPAVVNGKTVTEISGDAFAVYNAILYFGEDADFPSIVVAQDANTYTNFQALLEQMGEAEVAGITLLMQGEELPDTTDFMMIKANIDEAGNMSLPSTKIEYLDLSQASNLTKIGTGAFLSNKTNPSLKYLNLDGITKLEKNENMYGDSGLIDLDLSELIITTDLVSMLYDGSSYGTIGTLKIYPGNTTEIPNGGGNYTDEEEQVTVKKVEIAEGITKVGRNVFARPYSGIAIDEELILPESLVEIDNLAFVDARINTIKLPSKLTRIGASAFGGTMLNSLIIPASVQKIESYAFQNNSHLRSLVFEKNSKLTSIGNFAFVDASLTSIDLSPIKQNIEIGEGAFKSSNSIINSVIIEENIKLGNNCFGPSLRELILTTNETTLPSFSEATGLTKLIIKSDNLISIPLATFTDSPLTMIEFLNKTGTGINSSIQEIGYQAFNSAVPTTVIIPSTITSIGGSAFGSMPETSTIVIKKASSEGIELGMGLGNIAPWNGKAQVVYEP